MVKRNFFVDWFVNHGRYFQWREPSTIPFHVLITEVLLQQTKAIDVAKVWQELIIAYPNPSALALASYEEVLARIQFLGFGNKRTSALKGIAAWLVEKHDGQVPANLQKLLAIPFVGDYSARAVLCFAFDQKIEIVDANVLRLFSRYYCLEFNRDARRAPKSWEIARDLLPRETRKAKPHNYGLLDFTAQVCKPGRPLCEICPLNKTCCFGRIKINN